MHEEVADHPLFTGSIPTGIMSGEKPRFPSAGDHEALLRELQQMGVQHEDTTGRYGEPERSVIVYGLPRERMVALGKKYGQESVIHSEGGRHHLIYTNGPNAGHHHEDVQGQHEYFPSGSPEPADNYTKLPGGGYFRIGFDFDRMHPEAGAGGAEVPRSAVAGPVAKHELGHKLWAAVSELCKAANPTKTCPKCKGEGWLLHERPRTAKNKCSACMGHGKVLAEPDPKEQPGYHFQKADPPYRIEDLAGEYTQGAGLNYAAPTTQHVTDEGLLHHVGAAYMGSPDMLRDAETRRSYDALKRETLAQYEFLKRKGFQFTPVAGNATPHSFPAEGFDPKARTDFAYLDDKGKELGGGAPYDRDFSNLYNDIWHNRSLKVFTGGAAPAGHPLAEPLPGNDPLGTYNNAFRAVHDVFGHALGVERFNRTSGLTAGYDFGHVGEDHAFTAQHSMYSPQARAALAAETRGQNAAFHFGPNGKQNRASPATATYPEQKAISLPHQLATPGSPVQKSLNLNDQQERSAVADDQKSRDPRQALHGLYKTLRDEVEVYEAECVALRKAETARLEKKAPPGFDEDTMSELKRKHGEASALKIAWSAYDRKHGRQSLRKDEAGPRDVASGVSKAAATDGGMGDGGSAGFAMSEDDARAESYAKGEYDEKMACSETPMCKCASCSRADGYAKGEPSMTKTTLGPRGDSMGGGAPATPPPAPPPTVSKPTLPGEQSHESMAGGMMKDEPAGAAPTSPGPKPGVTPDDKAPKIALPQTKEGGNGLTKESIAKGAMPSAPTAGAAAAPKAPKLPGTKMPKLPGAGAVAAPKTPPMGAGTPAPNLKAEPDPIAKAGPTSLGPRSMAARQKFGERTQKEQAVKLPGVRASVGNLMDNMMATGPLNPGQPLSITPIASAPNVPVGARPSPTGGQAPAPKPSAAIPMVQRVAASLTAPPASARAGAQLPGAHLFAPKPVTKGEPTPSAKRYGKARVPGCECTSSFTCGKCLRAASPTHNTPSTVSEQAADKGKK